MCVTEQLFDCHECVRTKVANPACARAGDRAPAKSTAMMMYAVCFLPQLLSSLVHCRRPLLSVVATSCLLSSAAVALSRGWLSCLSTQWVPTVLFRIWMCWCGVLALGGHFCQWRPWLWCWLFWRLGGAILWGAIFLRQAYRKCLPGRSALAVFPELTVFIQFWDFVFFYFLSCYKF